MCPWVFFYLLENDIMISDWAQMEGYVMGNSYAVITGASSGLGKCFAEIMAEHGYNLVLIARREEELKKLAANMEHRYGCSTVVVRADLGDMKQVQQCFAVLNRLDVEIFINNAGFGEAGRFTETSLEKELSMIDVNIKAMHIFAKMMTKYFAKRGRGYLLNVASSAGLFPAGPFMATYYASKAYVVSLTKAIAEEVRQAGINLYVGCLCPGPVDTEFNKVANVDFALKGITPQYCTQYAYQEMMKGTMVIVPTLRMKAAVLASKVLPESLVLRITAMQQKRKKGL